MAADSDHQLQRIVEVLPEVLWLREALTGRFLYCSRGSERLWGIAPERVIQHPELWQEVILAEDRLRVQESWKRCPTTGALDEEYRVCHPDGTIRWIEERGWLLSSEPGRAACVAGVAREIAERKRLQADTRKAFDALHSSVNGVIITDRAGRITYTNPAFLSLFRYADGSAALGSKAEDLFVSADIEELSDVAHVISHSGRSSREFVVKRKDGSRVYVEVSSSEVHNEQGEVVGNMASFVEVTERKLRERETRQHHLRLRRLAERMADLEERERRRISSLIHDTTVQSLALSNVRLGAVSKALDDAGLEEEKEQLKGARELIADGIRQSRLIMADLTPPLLYEVGMGAALRQFADRIRQLQGVQVKVEEATPALVVPESLRGLLFQAAREFVMNACRHAAPSEINIRLSGSEQQLELAVRDNGGGFDPGQLTEGRRDDSGGFGLFSIRQRLGRWRGELIVKSARGAGSELRVILPVPAQPDT